jgi:hypothetical protein
MLMDIYNNAKCRNYDQNLYFGEIMAYQGKYSEAAKIYAQTGNGISHTIGNSIS